MLAQPYTMTQAAGVSPAVYQPIDYGASMSFSAQRPSSFDYLQIVPVAALVLGTEFFLVGTNTTTYPAPVGAMAGPGAVPPGLRGVIDCVSPYAEDPFGGQLPRHLPAGTQIQWTIYADRNPLYPFAAMTGSLDSWEDMSPRAQATVNPGQVMTASVLVTLNALGFTFFGIRIRGRWVPYSAEELKHATARHLSLQPSHAPPVRK